MPPAHQAPENIGEAAAEVILIELNRADVGRVRLSRSWRIR
jgi:hypothetical protein